MWLPPEAAFGCLPQRHPGKLRRNFPGTPLEGATPAARQSRFRGVPRLVRAVPSATY
jgi:hypothetical protein